jgi:hypothetical protein
MTIQPEHLLSWLSVTITIAPEALFMPASVLLLGAIKWVRAKRRTGVDGGGTRPAPARSETAA